MADISIQMWTVREEAARSLRETLSSLKKIGYGAVETAGTYGLTPTQMRDALGEAGLCLSSAHMQLPAKEVAADTFGQLKELGAPAVFPSLKAELFADDRAVGKAAESFNAVVGTAKDFGIELGYHNHWWEFESRLGDRSAYDVFVERLDPAVTLEVDTYWAQVGGVDAAQLVSSLGDRVHYLHVKDGPLDHDEENQYAVGDGKMDIDAVLKANPAVRWHVVELDGFQGDIWDAVRKSLEYFRR